MKTTRSPSKLSLRCSGAAEVSKVKALRPLHSLSGCALCRFLMPAEFTGTEDDVW